MTFKEEENLLNSFRNLYPDFPSGDITHDDAPDFTITNSNYIVGIELTEIFQDLDRNKQSKLKQEEVIHNKIGNLVVENLRRFTDFEFHITIDFANSFRLKGKKIDNLIREFLVACAPEIFNVKEVGHVQIRDFRILPEGIQSIGLWYSPKFNYSTYLDSEGGIVSNFTDHHLKRILQEKEKAIIKYKSCNEFWLLIKEGNFYAGSLDEVLIKDEINTSFDKVLLYRIVDKKIIELK